MHHSSLCGSKSCVGVPLTASGDSCSAHFASDSHQFRLREHKQRDKSDAQVPAQTSPARIEGTAEGAETVCVAQQDPRDYID